MNRLLLPTIVAGYVVYSLWGIGWGLYTPRREAYLFPEGSAWSPHDVARVRQEAAPAAALGADVDPDPLIAEDALVVLNPDDQRVAEIYARYLLYSGQPDEMITFRAIAAMAPAEGRFDPKLYQYGGLFIYPLAAGLKVLSFVGGATLAGQAHYLEQPADFARLYVVARLMVLAWGALGVWAAAVLGTELGDRRCGLLAALMFAVLPAVVSLGHEAKPHLPGAVLMMWSMIWALRYLNSGQVKHRLLTAACGGLAVGMVLSSLWIVLLVPLVELLRPPRAGKTLRIVGGLLVALGCYAATNPYVPINLFTNRAVLASNFGNSTAMYDVSNPADNALRAWSLLTAGSSPWIVVGGLLMAVALWGRDWRRTLVVVLPAGIVLLQFFTLAAGKPGEYGRFALLPNVVLAIVVAVGAYRLLVSRWWQYSIYGVALATPLAWSTLDYCAHFARSETPADSRYVLAGRIAELFPQEADAAPAASPNGAGQVGPSVPLLAQAPPISEDEVLELQEDLQEAAEPDAVEALEVAPDPDAVEALDAAMDPGAVETPDGAVDPGAVETPEVVVDSGAVEEPQEIRGPAAVLGVLRDPAPYGCPPLDFARVRVVRLPKAIGRWPAQRPNWPQWLVVPVNGVEGVELQDILEDGFYELAVPEPPADRAALTWAAKPLVLLRAVEDWRPQS